MSSDIRASEAPKICHRAIAGSLHIDWYNSRNFVGQKHAPTALLRCLEEHARREYEPIGLLACFRLEACPDRRSIHQDNIKIVELNQQKKLKTNIYHLRNAEGLPVPFEDADWSKLFSAWPLVTLTSLLVRTTKPRGSSLHSKMYIKSHFFRIYISRADRRGPARYICQLLLTSTDGPKTHWSTTIANKKVLQWPTEPRPKTKCKNRC